MPKITEVGIKERKGLSILNLPWLKKAIGSELLHGGIYLLAGEPGIGKTTLTIQILGDISRQGIQVLYIPTEQSLSDVKRVANRLFKLKDKADTSVFDNLFVDTIDDLGMLPWLLNKRILPRESEYSG